MGSTRRTPRTSSVQASRAPQAKAAAAPTVRKKESFESLRLRFRAKLESERAHFVTLSAALARAEENPVCIFEDLVYRAHRLHGGAAIFEESEVALAACELERAAAAAAQSRADDNDERVWTALKALVNLMGNVDSVRGGAQAW